MIAQADAEPDATKRQTLYAQIQRQLATEVANAFVMAPNDLAVIRANLHGYPSDQVAPSLRLGDAYFS